MKKLVVFLILLLLLLLPGSSQAELDLDQEVIIIPDTHNDKPYVWDVQRNPREYKLVMDHIAPTVGTDSSFLFEIKSNSSVEINNMHVFITDEDLHTFAHVRPLKNAEGKYSFNFASPATGKFRFEIVFKAEGRWVNISKDIKLKGTTVQREAGVKHGDEDYAVKVKLYPKSFYAEHAGTFLYELSYKGEKLKDIEKMDGFDMQIAAWDEDLKEFIYATPKQNLGGPEVAVSLVFMRSGKHAVFAEFKHNGIIRKIDFVINVLHEWIIDENNIESLRPSDF